MGYQTYLQKFEANIYYLYVIEDIYSRKIVGYEVCMSMNALLHRIVAQESVMITRMLSHCSA
ncbi:hypothetical protein BCS71_25885, partial [Vibrio lentus]